MLDFRIEVLHAIADTAEPKTIQCIQVSPGAVVGVTFRAKAVSRMERSLGKYAFYETGEIAWGEECRRSASQMQFPYYRGVRHKVEIELPFREDSPDVFFFHRVIGGDPLGASAIDAQGFAEREMDVQADAFLPVVL